MSKTTQTMAIKAERSRNKKRINEKIASDTLNFRLNWSKWFLVQVTIENGFTGEQEGKAQAAVELIQQAEKLTHEIIGKSR